VSKLFAFLLHFKVKRYLKHSKFLLAQICWQNLTEMKDTKEVLTMCYFIELFDLLTESDSIEFLMSESLQYKRY